MKKAAKFQGPGPPCVPSSLSRFPLQKINLAQLLLLLGHLISPFRSWLAWNLLVGKSLWQLARDLERLLVRLIGWLVAPPRHPILRWLGGGALHVRRWHLAVAAAVSASLLRSAQRRYIEARDEKVQKRRRLLALMESSSSYAEWGAAAAQLDALDGTSPQQRWRQETRLYDRRLLEEKVAHLRRVRAAGGGVGDQMFALRADLMRNLGNITNSALHEHFPVIPEPIRVYIEEVRAQLEDITYSPELPLEEKGAFLRETRHAFGRTALVLSGGGPLGAYHLGVVKALLEHHMLPRVLAGSSTGAIVCALVCTRTDEELRELLEGVGGLDLAFLAAPSAPQLLRSKLTRGGGDAEEAVRKRLRMLLGDLTFLEAFHRTGRILNIALAPADASEPPRLLNYLTAPHVVVWSAAAPCSAALAGAAHELLARSTAGELVRFTTDVVGGEERVWRDSSEDNDLPTRGLSEMFSANYFIVSQTNPRLVPLLNMRRALGTAGTLAETELRHRCKQLAEVLPPWFPTRTLRALSQPWEGDVTCVLPDTLGTLCGTLLAPSKVDLQRAVRLGELGAWAKLSAIQCNCGVEATLDAAIQQVSTWERQERRKLAGPAPALKARIPSWMTLPVPPSPHAPSAAAAAAAAAVAAEAGGGAPPVSGALRARSPSANGLGLLPASESRVSLAPSEGFENDGVYGDDDYLPLPEERVGALGRVYGAPEPDCIDSSVAWDFGAQHQGTLAAASTDALDALAF